MKIKSAFGLSFVIGVIVLVALVFLFSLQPIQYNSGIVGKILLGPLCPVENANEKQNCYAPYQATVIAIPENNFGYTRFSSNINGTFKVVLSPGTYTLNPINPNSGYPRAPKQTVIVEPNQFTNVLIVFDTGIR